MVNKITNKLGTKDGRNSKKGENNPYYKHGCSESPTYSSWLHINRRCNSPTDRKYNDYGGRGISVCERWSSKNDKGFQNFLADMGEKPNGTSVERVNNDGDYAPENCIWGTPKQQARNRRSNKLTMEKARDIRYLHQAMPQLTHKNIGDIYNVTDAMIGNIVNNKSWAEEQL